ncbi:mucin-5AC [Ceratitis capitata]|uniref:mucin-5AC n=1 Tax=Ceratitis capitata TaxID=7213 RepID=UPI000A11431F|nr:mucin-5AC [Ceratitis capitata]
MFGLPLALLLVAMFGVCQAQGTFEDAETSNDDTSINAHQHFDLRHTIPGEPEVDYPIYSEVPETSFECAGRHEGYYADMETRCQAFRICAHTARSVHGFGFLCPNGTLFSQKNFVCDWYRNVNCAESEQYYSKNNANRIGSSYDMMEKVRQMMEYPMKTISRALQNKGSSVANHPIAPQVSHHTLKKQLELAEGGTDVSETDEETQSSRDSSQRAYLARKQAVTRAQVESVSKSQQSAHQEDTVTQQRKRLQQQRQQQRTETEVETTKVTKVQSVGTGNAHDEDVYVNSLGELSSDPGVNFMHDSARIIAESPSRTYKYEKNANFAERVNVGLNNLADGTAAGDVIAPDYVKHLRTADEDAILAANINNLLEEVSADVDTSISGYQVPAPTRNKTSFRFLSRGFSSQSDRSKRPPYEYAKPKQTASTIRFSPNELPIDDTYKDTKEFSKPKPTVSSADINGTTFESNVETMQFIIMTTTPAPTSTSVASTEIPKEAATSTTAKVRASIIEVGDGLSLRDTTEESNVTTTAAPTYVNSERYYLNNVSTLSQNLDYNFLSPPASESGEGGIESSTADEPTLYEFSNFEGSSGSTQTVTEVSTNMDEGLSRLALIETSTVSATTPQSQEIDESADVYANVVQQLLFPTQSRGTTTSATIRKANTAREHPIAHTFPPIVDEEKLTVEDQAAKLLLAGVKLTKHDNHIDDANALRSRGSYSARLDPTIGEAGALLIHVDDETIATNSDIVDPDDVSSTSSSTTTTTTAQPETSTSIVASLSEGGSFQERIRNYRRLASQQRATVKPLAHLQHNQLNSGRKSKTTTTKPPSSSTTATTTRSYLKRVAASRLRLSRLSAANNRVANTTISTTTDSATVEYSNSNNNDIESSQTSRKIAVRNIDKELGNVDGGKRYDGRGNSFDSDSAHKRTTTSAPAAEDESSSSTVRSWDTVRNNLRRFQVSRKPSTVSTTTTTSRPARSETISTRRGALRSRNRFANFKTQASAAATTTSTPITTYAPTTTRTSTTTTAATATTTQSTEPSTTPYLLSPTPNLDHLLKSITSSVSYSTSSSTNTQAPLSLPESYQTFPLTSSSSSSSSSSASASANAPAVDFTFSSPPSNAPSATYTQDDTPTFLEFNKLTRAIVDNSVLQNFRSQQQQLSRPPAAYHTTPAAVGRSLALDSNARAVSNFAVLQSYNKLPPQATAQLTSTQRQPQQSQQQLLQPQPQPHRQPPTSPAPSIVIARAEGQRIAPSSLTSIISALATQPPPKTTPSTPYVALDDFLTKKFAQTGQGFTKTNAAAATTKLTNINYNNQLQQYKATQSQQQQQNIQPLYHRVAPQPLQPQKERQPTFSEQFQQQQQQQLLHQQQQLRQLQQNQHIQQQQQFNGNTLYQATYQQQAKSLQQPTPTSAQKPQQQLISNQLYYPQQQQQTSLITSNFFSSFKQNQQQQQPQFPPFFTSASGTRPQQQLAFNELSNNIVPPEHDKHFNVQLPALTAGLIPAPTLTAQRRMDVVDVAESESASIFHDHNSGAGGAYNGVSSYDVPLSSIGRLPNDITHFLRRLRKVK